MVNFRGRSKPHSRTPADGQWLHDKAPTGRSRDVSPKGSINSSPGSRLVVAGLHYEITPKDLNAIFGQVGTLISEPFIRYDRSGRSTGVAIVTYETTEEASKALKQFNGLLAKGQPMDISFDTSAPRPSRKSTTTALLNRIQKQPLLSRLAADSEDAEMSTKDSDRRRTGSLRSRGRRIGRGAQGGGRRGGKAERKPQTAEDLDKELEAFMGDTAPPQTTTATEKVGEVAAPTQDIDMA
ncbi:hypothetical protein PC9H_008692 [Pleurotus ostreatus]|uniref:RRM domain-containing protein n=2 Tax=Pleurotus TaxID=5320 RepID=A0A8H6ZS44_PLEOS|nr:uncharacterized protein PC9H_008692 [Pleurotus ostreatus]KAF7426324.1 hypothetical protein PC9H_008692 [Pleurotus ostreatus]KAG9221926.1 hypothetical protein CCMSSC00406_0005751 [Pleurotus cornucopiae]KAJ8693834.1 hypothetical protein PTI98_008789 [Pleurotus ostreatus]